MKGLYQSLNHPHPEGEEKTRVKTKWKGIERLDEINAEKGLNVN